MTSDDLLATVAVSVVLIGVTIAVILMQRSGRNRLARLSPAFDFGTARKAGLLGLTVEGISNGYACRYTIHPASQHDPGGASMRLAVSINGRWSAEVASGGVKLLVRVGVLRDLAVGDPDLDSRLRFAADDADMLRSLFGSETVRAAARDLLATENFGSVRLGARGFEARWSPRDRSLDEEAEIVGRRLAVFTNLAATCGYPPRLGL